MNEIDKAYEQKRRQDVCASKVVHAVPCEAMMEAVRMSWRDGKDMMAYTCELCGKIHVGTRTSETNAELTLKDIK